MNFLTYLLIDSVLAQSLVIDAMLFVMVTRVALARSSGLAPALFSDRFICPKGLVTNSIIFC